MTSSVETKEGGVNKFIYASIIGVCVPGRPKLFYSPPFQLFCTEQFVSTVNYGIRKFVVDEFSHSWITSTSAGHLFGVQTACLLARSKYSKRVL